MSPDSLNWGDWLLLGGDGFQYDYKGELFYSNSQVSNKESYFLQYRINLVSKDKTKPTIKNVTIDFTNPGDIHVIIAGQEARSCKDHSFVMAIIDGKSDGLMIRPKDGRLKIGLGRPLLPNLVAS